MEENSEQPLLSYGIIVLNYSKASIDKWLTTTFWFGAKIRICADGGSNELRKFTQEKKTERYGQFTPDFIIGDNDSITRETRQFYENELKVKIIDDKDDQDSTDFTKCLKELENQMKNPPVQNIYVFCTFAGRFDQAMGIIHTLYRHPQHNIYLISDQDITFLLKPGLNHIHQIQSSMCGEYCSLIPFAGPLKITTNGLKWNLDQGMELNFNALISTSNTYSVPKSDFVTIDTRGPLIWSMTFTNI